MTFSTSWPKDWKYAQEPLSRWVRVLLVTPATHCNANVQGAAAKGGQPGRPPSCCTEFALLLLLLLRPTLSAHDPQAAAV